MPSQFSGSLRFWGDPRLRFRPVPYSFRLSDEIDLFDPASLSVLLFFCDFLSLRGIIQYVLAAIDQLDRIDVVLVAPRNPLNIGAAARAMANFGFTRLTVVAAYGPHWHEVRSAVGAEDLLRSARVCATLNEALIGCTLVLGTGTLTYRVPEQPVIPLPALAPLIGAELERSRPAGRVALVFGPEKHGLARDDLALCHRLLVIPTAPRQPSMNLGQAVAVCLYEIATRLGVQEPAAQEPTLPLSKARPEPGEGGPGFETLRTTAVNELPATAADLDRLAGVIEDTMRAARYSPPAMEAANRHDLDVLLRRLNLRARDTTRMLGFFRRILWRLRR